ncbi:Protein MLTN-13 [Aphelenchoides avenae]|nr:Protein MLTN-13 [Aphelenchus avenae]
MAKCVASALDMRDRIKMQEAVHAETPAEIAYSEDDRILSKLVKILWPARADAAVNANEDLRATTKTAKESASAEKLRKDLKREKLRNRFKEAKRFNLNGFQDELVETHRRAIRSISQPKPHCKPGRNMDALRKVQLYFELTNYVQRFTKRISAHNERFLKRLKMPVDFENRLPEASSIAKQVHEFMDDIDRGSLSILSPKIMNLLPSDESKSSPNKLLSPNILSFHNEGVLPLPRLLGLAASSECDTLQWTDFLMELSGGAGKLRTLVRKLEPELHFLQEKMYPAVVKMEQTEKQWESLKRSHSLNQLKAMKKYGYTQLDPEQFEMLHGSKDHLGTTADQYRQMSVEEREQMLEEDIRRLAEIEDLRLLTRRIQVAPNVMYTDT